jgi:hypothetical protein
MLAITATEEWRTAHPGGIIGLLELAGLDLIFEAENETRSCAPRS